MANHSCRRRGSLRPVDWFREFPTRGTAGVMGSVPPMNLDCRGLMIYGGVTASVHDGLRGPGWRWGHRCDDLWSGSGECGLLGGEEFVDPFFCVVEHFAQLLAGVGVLFGGGLGLDEAPVGEHYYVHVDCSARVLFVAEVEEGVAVDDADAGGGDHLAEGRGF